MLRTVTEDLDYALKVVLPEVIFLITKDLFRISSEETKSWMEELLVTEELHQNFEAKVGRIKDFFIFLMFCVCSVFQNHFVALELKQPLFFIVSLSKTHYT